MVLRPDLSTPPPGGPPLPGAGIPRGPPNFGQRPPNAPGAGVPGAPMFRYPMPPRYGFTPHGYNQRPGGGRGGGGPGGGGGGGGGGGDGDDDYDGKRPRKSQMRKTVDYNCSFLAMVENRVWQRDLRDRRALQPDAMHTPGLLPAVGIRENPANAATTKFVKTATNKMRCPVFTLAWTPEGRRLITGASSGEFTLWNGLTFNFETILQAHDSPVRSMVWSHNDQWMVTGDHAGFVKYWQSNMNNVKMFQAHKEPVRRIAFSPSDAKFATCSDDGTVRVFDFFSCAEERVLRGHGSDVKCVDWHPTKGLIASGSKDNQQPVKIWDPRTGQTLCTLHAHKNTVMDLAWNANGNWLLTASRDHLLKLFDIRNTKEEVQTFRGHKKEASTLAWHPVHEGIFASGGSDGSIMFWHVGADKEVGVIEQAHESIVWSLAWHPIGHILCSGSNDHTAKFWTRNRPGDTMRDKYNLNTLPAGQEDEGIVEPTSVSFGAGGAPVIPGMAPEDRVAAPVAASAPAFNKMPPPPGVTHNANYTPLGERNRGAPSLGGGASSAQSSDDSPAGPNLPKKTPYAKPIPKSFQASWNDTGMMVANQQQVDAFQPPPQQQQQPFGMPPPRPDAIPLRELQAHATAVVAFGNVYPVLPGSNLYLSILGGERAVKDVIRTEFMSG